MVIVVKDNCIVADFLKKASFQVNHILPWNLHYSSETIDQPLDFLIIVKFVGDYRGYC